jgi:hypothetical protein
MTGGVDIPPELDPGWRDEYPLKAASWNVLVDFASSLYGGVRGETSPVKLRHPWFCDVSWDVAAETWTVQVRPGFIRGRDVAVRDVPAGFLGERACRRLELAWPPDEGLSSLHDTTLLEKPRIPIDRRLWRVVSGPDGESDTAEDIEGHGAKEVPEILHATWNVPVPAVVTVDLGAEKVTEDVSAQLAIDPADARQCRCLEVVLFQPCPRVVESQVPLRMVFGQAMLSEYSIREVDPERNPPRIVLMTKIPKPRSEERPAYTPSFRGVTAEWTAEDDHIVLATIWLLGPPGDRQTDIPDGDWTPLVEYRCAWNLDWAATVDLSGGGGVSSDVLANPLESLGFGVAATIGGGILDQISAETAQLLSAMRRAQVQTTWWNV